jgi:hypothetical protein
MGNQPSTTNVLEEEDPGLEDLLKYAAQRSSCSENEREELAVMANRIHLSSQKRVSGKPSKVSVESSATETRDHQPQDAPVFRDFARENDSDDAVRTMAGSSSHGPETPSIEEPAVHDD